MKKSYKLQGQITICIRDFFYCCDNVEFHVTLCRYETILQDSNLRSGLELNEFLLFYFFKVLLDVI